MYFNSTVYQIVLAELAFEPRIMARFALACILCIARSVWVSVEQPRSSLMKHTQFFKHIEEVLTGGVLPWLKVN